MCKGWHLFHEWTKWGTIHECSKRYITWMGESPWVKSFAQARECERCGKIQQKEVEFA